MLTLTAKDIAGLCSMPPTPSTPDASDWRAVNSVDLNTSAKMFSMLLKSGVSGFALCGTTGECASLLWEEKRAFIGAALEATRGKAYLFAGATALGTKETIRQMREFGKMGVEGAFIGLPLWQTPTVENAVQYYADLSEAVPDISLMVYGNATVFKFAYPPEFWEGIAKKAPTFVTNKISYGSDHIAEDKAAAGLNVRFIPSRGNIQRVYAKIPNDIYGLWSTDPWPEPYVALANALIKRDDAKVQAIFKEVNALPPRNPPNAGNEFRGYNTQVERQGWNSSDYLHLGPPRPPYRDLPDYWVKSIDHHQKEWSELAKRYVGVA